MSSKRPKRVADPMTMQWVEFPDPAPATAMQAVPDPAPATAVQDKDPVDDYLDRNYPGLSMAWSIPDLLKTLIRETVKTRFENGKN